MVNTLRTALFALSFLMIDCRCNENEVTKSLTSTQQTTKSVTVDSQVTTLASVVIEVPIPLQKEATILLVGDSLAVGMSHRFREIATECGYKPVSHTIGGTNTLQWTKWLKSDLEKYTPDLVLVVLGTNDAMQLNKMKSEGVYERLISLLNDRRFLWILPHAIPAGRIPNIGATRDAIKLTTSFHFDSSKINVPLAPDQIHSSPLGYKAWMEAIWKHLDDEVMIRSCSK